MPIYKGKSEITSLADCEALGGPKARVHWVPDRSAMEAVRSWLHDGGKTFPYEVARILATHPDFGPTTSWRGEPEVKLPFDAFAGEPRNTDVLVIAQDSFGSYAMAVEAKADEPFSATVAETLVDAVERKMENPRSNGVTRVEQLVMALLGPRKSGEPKIGELRYQLLTAVAGVLCEAERRETDRAILLVQEFITRKTCDEKHRMNAADLNRFLGRLSHGTVSALGTQLIGPFLVPDSPLLSKQVRLYVGKVTKNLRQ